MHNYFNKTARYTYAAWVAVIGLFVSVLYFPFLDNKLVFDDHLALPFGVLANAQTPFSLQPRTFPFFSLGFVQVLFGSIEAHRVVSLILHILCVSMLFAVLSALLQRVLKTAEIDSGGKGQLCTRAHVIAVIGASWFAMNPAAVYGAAYLVQRTILFATFFSLLSLWYYRRAFENNSTKDIVLASIFYSAAVFSKEHAVMLPFAVVPLATLYGGDIHLRIKKACLYVLLCAPAALLAVHAAKYAVASGYEPFFSDLTSRIHGVTLLNKPWGPWLVSAGVQISLFFDYVGYWIFPDVRSMSIDMRVDISGMWGAWWLIPKVAVFLACPLISLHFLRRGGLIGLFGCGLLYCWLLFFTEISTVRFQDTFVLYRSYLWAPGYAMMLVAVCAAFSWRWAVTVGVPVLIGFSILAHERLESLVTEAAAWKDAGAKISPEVILTADRIFYNRGIEYFKEKNYTEAISDFNNAILGSPESFHYYYQRGVAYYSIQDFIKAQADFNYAFELNRQYGPTQYALGMMYERRGCIVEARRAYTASLHLGVPIAALKLSGLEKNAEHKSGEKPSLAQNSCQSY
jgi:tetratricopeptide (TPR) repeat protein